MLLTPQISRIKGILSKIDVTFLLILGLGVLMRFLFLGSNDLWYDEILSMYPVSFEYQPRPIYPFPFFLYHSLISLVTSLFGVSSFVMRFPSAFFNSIVIFIIYRFALKLFNNKNIALISSLIFAFSPFQIWYSQEARNYSLFLLLSILSSINLYSYIMQGSKKSFLFYVLFSVAGMFTHPFCILLQVIQSFYFLFSTKSKKRAVFSMLHFALFVPFLGGFIGQFHFLNNGFWIPKPNLFSLVISATNFLIGYNGVNISYNLTGLFILGVIVFSLRGIFLRRFENNFLFCLFSFMAPILSVFLFSRLFSSFYLDRAFIIFTPYFYIWIAYVIENSLVSSRIKISLLLFLITALLLSGFRYYSGAMFRPDDFKYHVGLYLKKPVRRLVQFLYESTDEKDCIVLGNISLLPQVFYYLTSLGKDRDWMTSSVYYTFDPQIKDDSYLRSPKMVYGEGKFFLSKERIIGLSSKRGKVFFVGCDWARSGALDNNSVAVKKYLEGFFKKYDEFNFDGVRVYIYRH